MRLSFTTIVLALSGTCLCTDYLVGIPTVPFKTASKNVFSLQDVKTIVVDPKYTDATDTNGETLIPPTLHQFAETFADDLRPYLSHQEVDVATYCVDSGQIYLTLGDPKDFLDAAGRPTSEGYTLLVTQSGITITGASPLGVWWGTRTVLQQATLNEGKLPLGSGTDAPGWGTRGVMLDAGRHYYPPDFLKEMCSYLSFFKQNTFHVHISDNLINSASYTREESLELYAAFRLNSPDPAVAGLNKRPNESYYQSDFEDVQRSCASRGVTIIPELEMPGHALVISQWKPELGMSTDISLLNISNPDTIPTAQTIWKTFLPWFHSKTVHIGADEYFDSSLTRRSVPFPRSLCSR
jgi:hexosaminidase